MNVLNRIMSYEKASKKLNINESEKVCDCEKCINKNTLNKLADNFFIKFENYKLFCREKEILDVMNLEYWYKDIKTKNFIWRALFIFGNEYSYHKTICTKLSDKVEIECKVHGHPVFSKRANAHLLQRQGCPKCSFLKQGNKRRLTLEEFIKRARKIHGNKYDYSKVVYVNYDTDVIIICNNHNEPYEFPQMPDHHLRGEGCPICGFEKQVKNRTLTLEEFIEKANKVHGIGRYDYSKVEYVNAQTEVIIICHNHETPYEFPQTPNNHLCGEGCSLCKESKGAKKVRIFLENENIEFKKEKTFKGCKYKGYLRFDFYLPQYNLCIEFDGQQHFIPTKFKSEMTKEQIEENLKLNQHRDEIKNEYCKNNRIGLLRLNNLKTVEKELTEYFQTHKIIKEQEIFNL